ncbi:MAG: murein biosynthesis integral membrane protein MurJ, partial [Alphaproteobacteria bacterium]|nr:murein biosynthesis integral membrane protein MurJ [Alphaproteobacteria bacterium]
MRLIRSITTVGNYTILSRIAGFGRDLILAAFLGASPVMDALAVSIKIPSFFRRLFAEGAFNAAFVPLFAGTLAEKGTKEATTYAEEIMSLLVFILIALVVLMEIFMPQVMPIITWGFRATPERMEMVIMFTRITFPFIILISLVALYSGILNSLDRFVAAASSPLSGNIFIVIGLLLIGRELASGYEVAWVILISGAIQLVWVVVPTYSAGIKLRLLYPSITPRVKRFLKRMIPGAIGSGVIQINLFIGTFIASFLPEGGISFLYYADRLNQLPLSVIGTAVSTALLPLMSKQLRSNKKDVALHSQNRALEFSLLLVLPATAALMIAAVPFTRVLFERGEFSTLEAIETAKALMGYACGLPAYILVKVFSTTFFAKQDTKTPVIIAGISVLVDIVLSVYFVFYTPLNHIGIALATALASWVNALLLGYMLHRQGFLAVDQKLKTF